MQSCCQREWQQNPAVLLAETRAGPGPRTLPERGTDVCGLTPGSHIATTAHARHHHTASKHSWLLPTCCSSSSSSFFLPPAHTPHCTQFQLLARGTDTSKHDNSQRVNDTCSRAPGPHNTGGPQTPTLQHRGPTNTKSTAHASTRRLRLPALTVAPQHGITHNRSWSCDCPCLLQQWQHHMASHTQQLLLMRLPQPASASAPACPPCAASSHQGRRCSHQHSGLQAHNTQHTAHSTRACQSHDSTVLTFAQQCWWMAGLDCSTHCLRSCRQQ